MKNFKKFLSILLCISMVFVSSFSSVASVVDENITETTSKIEEQLKKDLGAEKAEELENINPEDLILDENLEVEEDIEVDDSKNDNENDNENDDVIKEESQIKEIEKENETESTDNVDEIETEKDEINSVATVSNTVDIELSKKKNSNAYGSDEPETWAWYYFTDYEEGEPTTLHLTANEPDKSVYSESGPYNWGHGIQSLEPVEGGGANNTGHELTIKRIIIDDKIIAKSCTYFFFGFTYVEIIENMSNLDISNVTDMSYMFQGCSSLTSIDVSNFNTSKVTDMRSMFGWCGSLTSIDLSSFNTQNVTDMSGMFELCGSLTSLNLGSFNTSNATNMSSMFSNCSSLTSINLSSFNTSKVINMSCIFASCSSLTSLDLSNFDTSNVKSLHQMFAGCSSLTSLDLSNFNTESVDFYNNIELINEEINSELDDADKVNINTYYDYVVSNLGYGYGSMSYMFASCRNLQTIKFGNNFKTDNVVDMSGMFTGCRNLKTLDLSKFNTSKVEVMNDMFSGCSSLQNLNLSNFDTSNVQYSYGDSGLLFGGMDSMFAGCSNLTSLNLSSFDTSKVKSMSNMFGEDSYYYEDDSGKYRSNNQFRPTFDTFYCDKLESITFGDNFDTSKVVHMSYMFFGCKSLKSLDLSKFNTENVGTKTVYNTVYEGFNVDDEGNSIEEYDKYAMGRYDGTAYDMSYMFAGCSSLTSLDLSNFDTSNVKSMAGMFGEAIVVHFEYDEETGRPKPQPLRTKISSCDKLTQIKLNSFDTSNVIDYSAMFSDCSSIVTIDLSSFSYNTNAHIMNGDIFYNCKELTTIYASKNMRFNCYITDEEDFPKLVGGKGTTIKKVIDYNDSLSDEEYDEKCIDLDRLFKIDKGIDSDQPGLLTYKPNPNNPVVTFNMQGHGTQIDQLSVEVGDKITKPADPVETGWTFDGWFKESECLNPWDFENDEVTADTELFAKWTRITWTVTFVTNNKGVTGANTIQPITVNDGEKVDRPENDPTAQGHEFLGWYSDAECINEFDFETEIKADTQIYADWKEVITYTISFNMNSHGAQVQALYIVENKYATEPAKPTVEGYSFKYWYQNDENVAFDFKNTKITTNIDLNAKWEENNYKIIYNLDGGKFIDGFVKIENRLYHEEVVLPDISKVEKTGHTFINWTLDAIGGTAVTQIDANTAEDVTVYANWSANQYNITYYLSGTTGSGYIIGQEGQDTVSDTYTYGIVKSLPTAVVANLATMSFAGWYENDNFTGSKITATTKTTIGDKNYYAKYEKKVDTYTITFRPGEGGSGTMTSQTMPAGKPTKLKNNTFTRSGYYMSHWTDQNGNIIYNGATITPTRNLTLTANWARLSSSDGDSSGGSSSGGGTAGPSVQQNNNTNNQNAATEVKTTQVQTTSKNDTNTKQVVSTNAAWVTDPLTGGFKLNVLNEQGLPVAATNGFYSLNSVVTTMVNNIPVQVPVSDTYFFDAAGNMVTGWVQTADNKWYFFDNTPNANMGKMTTGWREVQGSYYYFNPDGTMMTNGITPDGYTIGADGKWVR